MNELSMATERDGGDILAIYGPYVEQTAISLELEVPAVDEMAGRISLTTEKYPWLLCRVGGSLAGYALAGPHRARAAYQWSCEVGVYVAPSFQRRGVATTLYRALLRLLKLQGFVVVLAGITLPNEQSCQFHARFGFQPYCIEERIGYKHGIWHDTAWSRLQLMPASQSPTPLRTPGELAETEPWKEVFG